MLDARLDGLIVTGTEPRAGKLTDEPYWPAMTRLVDWARANTLSTVWSCLAAHAAVLHSDRIERRPLAEKLSGIFACETITPHPLMAGVAPLCVPHSRYNDLPAVALSETGYELLSRSASAGIDAFARQEHGGSLFAFFQGHPEYDTDSLLREYRRDIGLHLPGAREHYPVPPLHYFSQYGATLLDAFRSRGSPTDTSISRVSSRSSRVRPVSTTSGGVRRGGSIKTGSSKCESARTTRACIGVAPAPRSRRWACGGRRAASLTSRGRLRKQPPKGGTPIMKVRNSLKSLRGRHRDNRIVRRKGRVYVINKTHRRFKARQG